MSIECSKGINRILSSSNEKLVLERDEFLVLLGSALDQTLSQTLALFFLNWSKECINVTILLSVVSEDLLPLMVVPFGFLVSNFLFESFIILTHELVKSSSELFELYLLHNGGGHLDQVIQSVNISCLLVSHSSLEAS